MDPNYSYSSYPDSGDSSPRSREIDFDNPPPWEDNSSSQQPGNNKVKFLCSYGGKIHPRPHDNQLSYIGGDTKILALDRSVRFPSLLSKLAALCDSPPDAISFKYQLPGEDLDALISVTNDDDLDHMMHEYDRLYRASPKPARLRIFIFQNNNQSCNSARSFGSDDTIKSEKERFVEALNSAPIIAPQQQSASPVAAAAQAPPPNNVDFLFGLEKANAMAAPVVEDPVVVQDERFMAMDPIQKHIQDLQRLRLEEQQGIYRRKSDDNFAPAGGEYYKATAERVAPVTVQGGVPYWTDNKQQQVHQAGVFLPSTEQQVYMIPAPASGYHAAAPMMRPMAAAAPPAQGGYYTVQRMPPPEMYRDQQQQQQQQQMYSMIQQGAVPSMAAAPPSLPPQKAAGYSEGYGMVRPAATTGGVGMVAEAGGYGQVAYDSGMGRQVIYSAPGGVMGVPPQQMQTPAQAQYQAMGGADMRAAAGGLNPETAVKGVPKVAQSSV